MLLVREATEADARAMAPLMRACDVLECMEQDPPVDPLQALLYGVRAGKAYTVVDGVGIVCIYGVVPMRTVVASMGVVWMLGTDRVARHAKSSVRIALRQLRTWEKDFELLMNRVPVDSPSVPWLHRIGFEFGPADARGWVQFRRGRYVRANNDSHRRGASGWRAGRNGDGAKWPVRRRGRKAATETARPAGPAADVCG